MADEWTYVPPRRRGARARARAHNPATTTTTTTAPSSSQPAPAPRAPSSSAAEIAAAHASYAAQWAGQPCAAQLAQLVGAMQTRKGKVKKAVCLGVGSFDAESGWQARRKAHMQVLAFEQMVAWFERRAGESEGVESNDGTENKTESNDGTENKTESNKIQTLFQDPAFTAADTAFLCARGHSVVASPAGFAAIDTSTLVFGVHLYADVYAQALAGGLPEVFVGTGWAAWDDGRLGAAVRRPERLGEMEGAGWCRREFPQDEGYTFSSTVVYWREEEDKPEQKPTSKESALGDKLEEDKKERPEERPEEKPEENKKENPRVKIAGAGT